MSQALEMARRYEPVDLILDECPQLRGNPAAESELRRYASEKLTELLQGPGFTDDPVLRLVRDDPSILMDTGKSAVYDLPSMMTAPEDLRINYPEKYDDCTNGELASGILYSTGLYKKLNPALRSGDFGELSPIIHGLSSLLSKGPHYFGTAYRFADHDSEALERLRTSLRDQRTICMTAFSSSTQNEEMFSNWEMDKDENWDFSGNTCFVIEAAGHGRDIQELSDAPNEKEILFNHHTDFQVTGFDEVAPDKFRITMKAMSHGGFKDGVPSPADLMV